ncbi:hypothetical protein GCK72_001289 [Caenorhabditis remanei]|uniref:RecQ mediated genome instability protein 1 OB-fold domain-containing protein n=1 Tax=Caenorhabditis remanei TaxID=31234 RepID=A0A6A5HUP0_CAERE|nr:hypothetical protein GCK72_001289 [Caenorhabditis remanei]KAF1769472.1 hypothetical protein GCK72_001289 [Caenorhabditis remanei]
MRRSLKMFDLVMQQFLNSKISDTLNPVMKIPINASKVMIVKRMVFQITSYTNISVSLYEQLSVCTRHNEDLSWFHGGSNMHHDEENRETEKDTIFQAADKNNNFRPIPKKRGMFKLEITDGLNTVKAIELEEIFDETLVVPGSKILLTGSVKCRRGVFLLEKSNCMFLGGQIESLHIDKIKQLSAALNIDLDAEKKRRQESLEKAAASVSGTHRKSLDKKNTSVLNQSSLSPFLIKTNRKTGEVMNSPKVASLSLSKLVPSVDNHPANPDPIENWDFSIEEIAQHAEPTPEPTKCREIRVEEPSSSSNLQNMSAVQRTVLLPPPPTKKLSSLAIDSREEPIRSPVIPSKMSNVNQKPQRREGNRTIEDWAFDSLSSLEKTTNLKQHTIPDAKVKSKQLPGHLLRSSSNSIEQMLNLCRPTLGDPKMAVEKRKEISQWVWDEKKGSEEEDVSSKQKKDDSVVEIPQCLIKQGRNSNTKILESPKAKSPSIHTLQSTSRVHVPTIDYDQEDQLDESDEVVPVTPYPKHPNQSLENEEYVRGVEETYMDASIMECTIEQEGRLECERWGLNGRKRGPGDDARVIELNSYSIKKRTEDQDYDNRNQPLPPQISKRVPPSQNQIQPCTKVIDESETAEYAGVPSVSQYHTSQAARPQQQQTFASTNDWNFTDRQKQVTHPPRVKVERVERHPEEKKISTMMRVPAKNPSSSQDVVEIRNKQSANVQIYKTPFAKRLNSTDSSSTATSQLFQRMSDLQIVPLADALVNRKFWMMSKIIVAMPTICHQLHELRSDGIDWLLQISVTDTSAPNVKCRVATDLLNRLFGFNVQQCKNLFNSNQVEELRTKKCEAERKLLGFKRLDLLVWIEVSPDLEKLPLIVDVKTISDALNIL